MSELRKRVLAMLVDYCVSQGLPRALAESSLFAEPNPFTYGLVDAIVEFVQKWEAEAE